MVGGGPRPNCGGGALALIFRFPQKKKKVEQARHIELISDVIEELSNAKLELKCTLSAVKIKPAAVKKAASKLSRQSGPTELATISNIFGSAEMLES